jgi:hypothetical protein
VSVCLGDRLGQACDRSGCSSLANRLVRGRSSLPLAHSLLRSGTQTGTVRRAANRQDRLDANYRRDPGRGADEGCSLVRMWVPAHGSRSAHTLLYLAAVRDDWCEHQPCRVRGPNTLSSLRGWGRRRSWSPWPGLRAHRIWLLGVVVQRVGPTGGYA